MRALITGASRGIGRATAERLAGPEVALAVHYFRHDQEARELAEALAGKGPPPLVLRADLGHAPDLDDLVRGLLERWDSLDVLVHNAGGYPRAKFEELTDEEFEACLRSNLVGPAHLTRRLLPALRKSGHGRIVFVSSVLAFMGSRHGAHYAAAKAGLVGLARSLAQELAPSITVNVVAPGAIDTAILAGDTPEVRRDREAKIPLGRVGSAAEVADAIAFLASPQASYITGAVLHVNGGWFSG